jgi:hypothetical protein
MQMQMQMQKLRSNKNSFKSPRNRDRLIKLCGEIKIWNMNKLATKLKSEITYLPNQELKIEILKPSLQDKTALIRNWRFYFEKVYRYVAIPIFLIGLVLYYTGYISIENDSYLLLVFYAISLTHTFFINGKISQLKSIIFTRNTMDLKYWNTLEGKKEMRIGYESLYFEVKVFPNLVELRIENYTIPLENVADFPMVIDQISELWDFEYYDTFHTSRNSEILIYKPKSAARFEPNSFLHFEETIDTIKFLDKMNIASYFEIDKNTSKINSSKFDKMRSHSGKIKRIEITMVSKIRFSNKFILTVVLIYENNESQYIFESDKRLSEDELTVLRDMEKIYEVLRKVKVLDDVEIVKAIV